METKDLPAVFATFFDQEKLDRIGFVVESFNQGLLSLERADMEIDKIIREEVKNQ